MGSAEGGTEWGEQDKTDTSPAFLVGVSHLSSEWEGWGVNDPTLMGYSWDTHGTLAQPSGQVFVDVYLSHTHSHARILSHTYIHPM